MDGSAAGYGAQNAQASGYAATPGTISNQTKMPPMLSAIDRMQRLANELADLADQLHGQATRVIGNNAVAPPSAPLPDGKLAENAPLMSRLDEALSAAQRNVHRARAGANRLSEIG